MANDYKRKQIKSVQALRGISALLIMFYHFRWSLNTHESNVGDNLFWWASISVDLFFVISGFVIFLTTRDLDSNINNLKTYFLKRIKRIFPAYYFLLLLTLILGFFLSGLNPLTSLKNIIGAFLFMPLDTFNPPFYIDDTGVYGIRWTLNYEVYFYLVIGLFIFIKNDWRIVVAYFVITISVIPLLFGYDISFSKKGLVINFVYLQMITNPIIYIFMLGYLIGVIYDKSLDLNPFLRVVILICSSVVFCIGVFKFHMIKFDVSSSGCLLAFLFYGVTINDSWIQNFIPSFFSYLGECSLSLYLIHTILNHYFLWVMDGSLVHNQFICFFNGCIISIVCAVISYEFIEKPFYHRR